MTSDIADMSFTPQRAKQLLENFQSVVSRVNAINTSKRPVRIVLVSKLKPASDILALHTSKPDSSLSSSSSSSTTTPQAPSKPASHFGENYVQELTDKAAQLPRSIRWHFIGGLQSNKCKALAGIPNLWCVSSVDTAKKADLLEKGRADVVARVASKSGDVAAKDEVEEKENKDEDEDDDDGKLRIMVQVNTSGEESKSGTEPGEQTIELCRHVRDECPSLRLAGLMTIGAIARSQATTAETENEDFTKLLQVRDDVAKALDISKDKLELSMGMSADYEGAITHGSDEVRIGSTIFGERPQKRSETTSEQDKH